MDIDLMIESLLEEGFDEYEIDVMTDDQIHEYYDVWRRVRDESVDPGRSI